MEIVPPSVSLLVLVIHYGSCEFSLGVRFTRHWKLFNTDYGHTYNEGPQNAALFGASIPPLKCKHFRSLWPYTTREL
jgi:hypothetical protein